MKRLNIRNIPPILCLLLISAMTMETHGAVVFSDDFDTIPLTSVTASGTNAGYKIVYGAAAGAQNFTAVFGFDYGTITYPITIPSAPNSTGGSTKGLFLTVNKNAALPNGAGTGGNAAAINLYPTNQSFSGSFVLKFDVWMNWTNLATSTEFGMFGINHSGVITNRIGQLTSDGLFFAMSGDGGASATSTAQRDYSVFRGGGNGAAPVLMTTNNTTFGPSPLLGTRFDSSDSGISGAFPSLSIPGYPTTPVGSPGLAWVHGEVRYETNVVTWTLNNNIVAQYTNATVFSGGNIMLGYIDPFGGSIGDTNNFAIFDNIVVEDLGGPPIVSVTNSIPTGNEAGPTPAQFTITRVGSAASAITVNYTLSGSATHGTDYTNNPPAGSVTLAPGDASTNIIVMPIDDSTAESTETVTLTVDAGVGYVIGSPSSRTVAIVDDEPATVSLSSAQPILLECYSSNRSSITITRVGLTNSALTVNLSYSGTAALGSDFNGPASASIGAGATTTTFNLTPIDDKLYEGAETAIINLAAGAYNFGSPSSATNIVVEDELAPGTTLFADAFDQSDTATNWIINYFNGPDIAEFGFDYSTIGIPEAPSSSGAFATTRGLKFRVNETAGAVSGLSVSPTNGNFNGNYRLRFDMWLNYAGGLNNANVPGQTQTADAGVGTTGYTPVMASLGDCVWFTANGDGGSAAVSGDYNAYTYASGLFGDATGVYAAGTATGVRDNVNSYYAPWSAVGAPAAQIGLVGTQTNTTSVGSIGMAWHCVTISKRGTNVTWDVDGRRFATVDITGLTLSTNISIGYHDPFASLTTNAIVQFGLFDNVRVESLGRPVITDIQIINSGTQVQVDFTAEPDDTADLFELESAGAVAGTYALDAFTITSLGNGKFRAVAAIGVAPQFYRIHRL